MRRFQVRRHDIDISLYNTLKIIDIAVFFSSLCTQVRKANRIVPHAAIDTHGARHVNVRRRDLAIMISADGKANYVFAAIKYHLANKPMATT
jgi:hypothetical protein